MHHRYDDTKMITINNTSDTDKGRWAIHQVSTHLIPWEISWNNTHIQAIIHQWCRHQIRIHCACHGNPIIGETLYNKQHTDDILHLYSIGIVRDQLDQAIVVDPYNYK
jgi:23S rRNA-/tRNA-specific pseudouridylate synthase